MLPTHRYTPIAMQQLEMLSVYAHKHPRLYRRSILAKSTGDETNAPHEEFVRVFLLRQRMRRAVEN